MCSTVHTHPTLGTEAPTRLVLAYRFGLALLMCTRFLDYLRIALREISRRPIGNRYGDASRFEEAAQSNPVPQDSTVHRVTTGK